MVEDLEEQPEVFEDVQPGEKDEPIFRISPGGKVSDKDIFNLAKSILMWCAVIFIIIALLRAFLFDNAGVTDVWDFSKVALNSIISLVLGLYFGAKSKDKI